ncbi:MAG: F-type H+-transporting ATPase subunit delta [Candidatus Azotimanducaceae bacterium]|jgi:F-type H+-transporting ATPase subunit delta
MAEVENSTAARPYARAAFSSALDEASGLMTWSRMLNQLAATVVDDVVSMALEDPRLSAEDEAALLIGIMGEELNVHGQNFVHILADYGRIALLPDICRMFEMFRANHEKTMEVQITSAFEVEEADKEILIAALKKNLQRDISITTTVDRTLLGGVVIRAEDTVTDNSVRGKLNKLSLALN